MKPSENRSYLSNLLQTASCTQNGLDPSYAVSPESQRHLGLRTGMNYTQNSVQKKGRYKNVNDFNLILELLRCEIGNKTVRTYTWETIDGER